MEWGQRCNGLTPNSAIWVRDMGTQERWGRTFRKDRNKNVEENSEDLFEWKARKWRARAGVINIAEKAREATLRWFGHIQRMDEEDPMRRAWKKPVRGRRSVGRQRIRWKDVVKRDMRRKGLRVENTRNRVYKRQHVIAADPLVRKNAKKNPQYVLLYFCLIQHYIYKKGGLISRLTVDQSHTYVI